MGTANDASSAVLWLEAWSPESGRVVPPSARGAVCQRHGDAMAPPQGWSLDDRREAVPRLFKPKLVKSDDQKAVEPTGSKKVNDKKSSVSTATTAKKPNVKPNDTPNDRTTRRNRGADLPRPRLFGENKEVTSGRPTSGQTTSGQTTSGQPESEPVGSGSTSTSRIEPHDEPVTVEPGTVEPVTVEHIGEAPNDVPGDLPPDSTKPWVPFFDPDDDLGGALDATGPLLREAFRPRGSNRRRDDSVG